MRLLSYLGGEAEGAEEEEAEAGRGWALAAVSESAAAALLLCRLGDRLGEAHVVDVGFLVSFFFELARNVLFAGFVLNVAHHAERVLREEGVGSHWAAQPPPGRQQMMNLPFFNFFSFWALGQQTTARPGSSMLGCCCGCCGCCCCGCSWSSVVSPSSSSSGTQMGAAWLPNKKVTFSSSRCTCSLESLGSLRSIVQSCMGGGGLFVCECKNKKSEDDQENKGRVSKEGHLLGFNPCSHTFLLVSGSSSLNVELWHGRGVDRLPVWSYTKRE
jgi:hypothetical protein